MVGDPIETSNGLEFILERVNYPSWYGEEMQDVILSIERQTEQRLNIKVCVKQLLYTSQYYTMEKWAGALG